MFVQSARQRSDDGEFGIRVECAPFVFRSNVPVDVSIVLNQIDKFFVEMRFNALEGSEN